MLSLILLSVISAEPLTAEQVRIKLNEVRAKEGILPLKLDITLSTNCKTHARLCASKRSIFHSKNRPPGVKEGVCFHFNDPVYALATPQTPLHREDALDKNCVKLGVGYAYDNQGIIYWVLQYAK